MHFHKGHAVHGEHAMHGMHYKLAAAAVRDTALQSGLQPEAAATGLVQ
jgi:hypothetical protein